MLENLFRSRQIERRSEIVKPDGTTIESEGNGWNVLFDVLNTKDSTKVTNSNAMTFNTVYACISVLADDFAKLPLHLFYEKNGKLDRRSDHELHKLISLRPNPYMSAFVYRRTQIVDMLTHGNSYSLIRYNQHGKPIELLPLSPTKTRMVMDANSGLYLYETTHKGKEVQLQPYEIFHLKAISGDGLVGVSPIQALRNQIESYEQSDLLNRKLIEGGGVPSGILKVASSLNKDAKQRVKDEWRRMNSNESIAIIDSGLEYQSIGVSSSDMQFMESQRYNQQQIAAVFKVPLSKINDHSRSTYSNVEQMSLSYVKNSLMPLITAYEQEANYKLFSEKEQRYWYVKFNLDVELRGDALSRAKVMESDLRNGFLTVNEGRRLNERSPFEIDLADKPMATLNYTSLERLEEYQYREIDNPVLTQKPQPKEKQEQEEAAPLEGGDED